MQSAIYCRCGPVEGHKISLCQRWSTFVNSLPSQGTVSHGTNSMSSCQFHISRSFPITSREGVYNSCSRSAMFHASEIWAPTLSDLYRLQCNGRYIIRWMHGDTTKDQISSPYFLERMQLDDLTKVLHTHALRCDDHIEHSDAWPKKVQKLNPTWGRRCGRPKKT